MNDQVRVFDSWGNYIGVFTEESGCSSGFAVIILIAPLLSIFYLVNVFRIGMHLIEKGKHPKALLWFIMWLYAPMVLYVLPNILGKFIPLGTSTDLETLPLAMQAFGYLWIILVCTAPVMSVIHMILTFRYSSLKF